MSLFAQWELLVPAGKAVEGDLYLAVLKMIFQLHGDNFFLTPAGHFNPDHLTSWARRCALENLIAGRGSVVTGVALQPSHPLYHAEYAAYTNNLLAIVQHVLPYVTKAGFPICEAGRALFNFIHSWFDKRSAKELERLTLVSKTESSSDEEPGVETNELDSKHELFEPSAYQFNHSVFLKAAKTHSFNPLCVYIHGPRDLPLCPTEYSTVLPGAIAQVMLTLTHKLLKCPGNTASHFVAAIDEIEVIDQPVKVSLVPSKANNGTMFHNRGPSSDEPSSSLERIRTA